MLHHIMFFGCLNTESRRYSLKKNSQVTRQEFLSQDNLYTRHSLPGCATENMLSTNKDKLEKRNSLQNVPTSKELCYSPVRERTKQNMRSLESIFQAVNYSQHSIRQENLQQLETWSESLDKLLKDPAGIHNFSMYLRIEHSSENIRFWLACENYKKSSVEVLHEKAKIIYNEFLSRRSPNQVNLDSQLVNDVRDQIAKPTKQTFLKAQCEIFRLMKTDSYPRFLKSTKYQQLLADSSNGKPKTRYDIFLANQDKSA